MKPETELLLAYDDPLGVTAAFNRNLLVRINVQRRDRRARREDAGPPQSGGVRTRVSFVSFVPFVVIRT